jgi:hypothetical protein
MGAFATLAILTNCFLFGFVSDQMQSWMPGASLVAPHHASSVRS